MKKLWVILASLFLSFSLIHIAEAVVVDSGTISIIDFTDIIAIPSPVPTGSGLGNLDLNMIQQGLGGSLNQTDAAHNYDNANTDMATGATTFTNESYITSFGDLRSFYNYNFPSSPINDIVLFLNVNETGVLQDILLNGLNIVLNYTTPTTLGRDNPLGNDIGSIAQNSTNGLYDGGTRIAKLGSGAPFSLPQIFTGIGIPDYYILTGINPFDSAYLDSDRILFHWLSSVQNDGGEVVYLSGRLRKEDLQPPNGVIPEPTTMSLLGLGLFGFLKFRKREGVNK